MINCPICQEEVSEEEETIYNSGKLIHKDCFLEYDGELEEILQ